jgi:hypothetical protein
VRDGLLLIGLAVTFVIQLIEGVDVSANPGGSGAVDTIAILVAVCFLVGIARAWELIGGPSIGITHEVTALVVTKRAWMTRRKVSRRLVLVQPDGELTPPGTRGPVPRGRGWSIPGFDARRLLGARRGR